MQLEWRPYEKDEHFLFFHVVEEDEVQWINNLNKGQSIVTWWYHFIPSCNKISSTTKGMLILVIVVNTTLSFRIDV